MQVMKFEKELLAYLKFETKRGNKTFCQKSGVYVKVNASISEQSLKSSILGLTCQQLGNIS